MESVYCVIMTTVNDKTAAQSLTRALLDQNLAACVQHMPINSFYTFEGRACADAEILLLIKTRGCLYAAVEDLVRAEHPYAVPELLMLPVANGLPEYLAWLDAETV